jgi:hypothetical protein
MASRRPSAATPAPFRILVIVVVLLCCRVTASDLPQGEPFNCM